MEGSCTWDGTLSLDNFHASAKMLSERWKEVNSGLSPWTWIPCQRLPWGDSKKAEGYLSLENTLLLKSNEEHQAEGSYFGEEEPLDDATLVQSYNQESHIYDFHILYSNSYRVPVLYFRGYRSDGQPLALDDIEKDLPSYSSSILKESKWTFMTQEDHPYLKRPWFTLHPCGTSDWMKLLFHGHVLPAKDVVVHQYLLSWLSVVGQAVGLRIPLEMINKHLQPNFLT
ncbi:ubiquitin-like-conjugating enzyme ATG10 [Magnolia sinica]|uniref:ubiquitin-like-conjugating enzyme ATG10 n=1 Tax=Magnolia sinica TaxID=86752 RepID=UPI00265867C1|nr:ubiquitin-like-conjugating enzyme ATG10 [Magnolia sinica]XP_058101870.1 ubiquitin-like-conjugating enzyme ATG10 [Magnolia sinica]XP_058101871.1 ubiquitin-like-conjugating enzyme ATG10 [Magnolia sinica]